MSAVDADLVASSERAYHVLGIVPAGTRLPALPGADAGGLLLLACEQVAALVHVVPADQPLGTRADLVTYSTVLDAVAAHGPVVPVRFGSVLAGREDVVTELLAPNHERFADLLSGLAGRVQFTVRARYEQEVVLAEVLAERPDIAALREQTRDQPEEASYYARVRQGELISQAVEDKRAVDGQALLDAMAPHAVSYHVREGSGPDHLSEVSFLVSSDERAAFEDAAEALAEMLHARARVRLLGPLAPYDFVPED